MNWTEIAVSALVGAGVSEIVGGFVTLFFLERMLKRMEYRENRRVRHFAYARTLEIASGVLSRLLPGDDFVRFPYQVEFGNVSARCVGYPLKTLDNDQKLADFVVQSKEFGPVPEDNLAALRGYLSELEIIIMGFGRLTDSAELEDLVSMSRSLSVYVRAESEWLSSNVGRITASRTSSYVGVILDAAKVVRKLEGLGSRAADTSLLMFDAGRQAR